MSELKVYVKPIKTNMFGKTIVGQSYYLKSEADKVIAELKAENERLRGESCKLTDGCLRLKQCRKEKAHLADELRHSNHKRCLAMAWWCERKRIDAATFRIPREKWDFYDKWYNRWLALAEEPTWERFLQLIHKEGK